MKRITVLSVLLIACGHTLIVGDDTKDGGAGGGSAGGTAGGAAGGSAGGGTAGGSAGGAGGGAGSGTGGGSVDGGCSSDNDCTCAERCLSLSGSPYVCTQYPPRQCIADQDCASFGTSYRCLETTRKGVGCGFKECQGPASIDCGGSTCTDGSICCVPVSPGTSYCAQPGVLTGLGQRCPFPDTYLSIECDDQADCPNAMTCCGGGSASQCFNGDGCPMGGRPVCKTTADCGGIGNCCPDTSGPLKICQAASC